MRFVLFSDLHLDAPFAWMGGARRRGEAQRETLRRIAQLARERAVDALLVGGDLYEQTYFTPDTAEFLRRTFAELDPLRVFLAPGNHDWYSERSLYARVPWSANVHVFTEARLRPVRLDGAVTLWGAAHRAPANTDGFLDGFRVEGPGVHIALFHGSERGWLTEQESGKVAHAPFEAGQIVEAGLHHAFLGHYHRPKDGDHHTYPGNPEPLVFGEDGDRGAVVATVHEDGRVERERVVVAVHDVARPLVDDHVLHPAHLVEQPRKCVLLGLRVDPPVVRVGEELVGRLLAVGDDAVTPRRCLILVHDAHEAIVREHPLLR